MFDRGKDDRIDIGKVIDRGYKVEKGFGCQGEAGGWLQGCWCVSGIHNVPSRDWDGIGGRFSGRGSVNTFWPFLGKPEVVTQTGLYLFL